MQQNYFIDLHCHPSTKAFARSFEQEPIGRQSANRKDLSSVWRTDNPTLFDKTKNYVVSLTNFIQSDATNLFRGKVAIACLSFYPQEKGFFENKVGSGHFSDALTTLATEFGKTRINFIQAHKSYWEDLRMEMDFLLQREGKEVMIDGQKVTYMIARSYDDIEVYERTQQLGKNVILFVPTIEGGHVFDQVMNSQEAFNTYPKGVADQFIPTLLTRVADLRSGGHNLIRPAFITLAHHFWNGLCGHSKSIGTVVKCVVDQKNGMGEGFFEAGRMVVRELIGARMDPNGNALPIIPIDIKHMSRKSRLDYFDLLDAEFSGIDVPVLCSHGCVTGLRAPGDRSSTPAAKEGLFITDDINLYDDEILRIASSAGVFGIQLDERRIGSKQELRKARGNIARRDILYSWSKLVWNQIRHIAELLDMNGRFSWGIQSLGTDFDGIIDPINGYWTAKSIDNLDDYLLKHAYNYLKEVKISCPLTQEQNRNISPEEVVDRFMTGNALNFLAMWLRN